MEIMVAVVIIALMAAVIAPNVIGALDRARISAANKTLQGLAQGIREFHADVGEYPGELTQLSAPITTGLDNSCGANYNAGEVNLWRGPYVDRTLSATGVPLGIGTASNALFRVSADVLALPGINVHVDDILALDALADGGDGAAAGSIAWIASGVPNIVIMGYLVPINGC
jgi:type II secretory pathway pseudopilin PulG